MSDLGGFGISRVSLRDPRWGVREATGVLVDSAATLVPGQRAVLTIGNRAMVGTVKTIGPFGGSLPFTWEAGAGGWSGLVGARSYGDPSGNQRSRVLADLGVEAKEDRDGVPVLGIGDGSLGPTWARAAGFARDALDALAPHASGAPNIGGQWWIDDPGVTHVGPRLPTSSAPQTMSVEAYDPATLRARVTLSDDAIAQLVPGATVTATWIDDAPASSVLVGSVAIHADGDSIVAELFGEKGAAELLADLIAALTAYTRWHATYPMQVSSVAGATTNVDPLNALGAALMGLPALPQWPGVPGMFAMLAKGAPVGVSFLGGSPGGGVITSYGPGVLPTALTFAAQALAINGPVTLGGPIGAGSPVVVDIGGALTAWIVAVSAATGATAPLAITSSSTKAVP